MNKDIEIQLNQIRKTLNKIGKTVEENSVDIAILKKDSHPPIFTLKDYANLIELKQILKTKEK